MCDTQDALYLSSTQVCQAGSWESQKMDHEFTDRNKSLMKIKGWVSYETQNISRLVYLLSAKQTLARSEGEVVVDPVCDLGFLSSAMLNGPGALRGSSGAFAECFLKGCRRKTTEEYLPVFFFHFFLFFSPTLPHFAGTATCTNHVQRIRLQPSNKNSQRAEKHVEGAVTDVRAESYLCCVKVWPLKTLPHRLENKKVVQRIVFAELIEQVNEKKWRHLFYLINGFGTSCWTFIRGNVSKGSRSNQGVFYFISSCSNVVVHPTRDQVKTKTGFD